VEDQEYRQAAFDEWKTIASRIMALSGRSAVAIAAGAAQRLMDKHLSLPEDQRNTFIIGWIPVLALLWQSQPGDSTEVDRALRDRMQQYLSGPYSHHLADEALPGSDENAAAAAIYATEAYCNQSATSACAAAQRLVDAAAQAADELSDDDLMSAEAEARRVRFERVEIRRLNAAVAVLEREGITEASLRELRGIFALKAV
jgi:hypothetical protein